jgi:hypothetical protein
MKVSTRRIKILRKSEVFSVVPLNELKVLATMFEPREFSDGDSPVPRGGTGR